MSPPQSLLIPPALRHLRSPELRQLPLGCPSWETCTPEGTDLLKAIKRIAKTDLAVYLEGDTGVGKDVLAQMIHHLSGCHSGPFIALHCAAISDSLAESELFGHVKGAFTGAFRSRPGALMQAHGGTLFLDEIADLPPSIQTKLLRFLETGELKAVGSDTVMHAKVRVISATHKKLPKLVANELFRQDLFYRLTPLTLRVPSLNSRPSDIEFLAEIFANKEGFKLSRGAKSLLRHHAWRGNVRELKHCISRAIAECQHQEENLPASLELRAEHFQFLLEKQEDSQWIDLEFLNEKLGFWSLEQLNYWYIEKTMQRFRGNRSQTARTLGIARSTLCEILKRQEVCQKRSYGPYLRESQTSSVFA